MPTVVTRYLNTASTAGGDGTTNATTGANRAWATLEEARGALVTAYASLVTSDVQVDLSCSGATDDTTAVTDTWPTSDTTRYLCIKVPDADRKAQWDDNVYTLARSVDGSTSAVLEIGTNSIRLQGLQIYQLINSGNNFPRPLGCSSLGGEWICDGVKMRGSGSASNSVGFKTSGTSGRFVFRNCLTIDTLHGFLIGNPTGLGSGSEVDLYNCTVIGANAGGGEGYQLTWVAGGSGKIARVKNCISRQIANGISTTNENTEDLATNNHSSLGVGSTDFVDPTNKDLRLKAGSGYLDIGTNLSGVSDWPFSTDASLNNRPSGSAWDQGFHEFQVPATERVFMAFID